MSYTSFDFPHTHFYDDDLRELIRIVVETRKVLHDFVSLNTIKYADPIQWNITTQYPGNTVVIDPVTGTAYLSTRPVPSGVPLSNTNYWTEIFNLGMAMAESPLDKEKGYTLSVNTINSMHCIGEDRRLNDKKGATIPVRSISDATGFLDDKVFLLFYVDYKRDRIIEENELSWIELILPYDSRKSLAQATEADFSKEKRAYISSAGHRVKKENYHGKKFKAYKICGKSDLEKLQKIESRSFENIIIGEYVFGLEAQKEKFETETIFLMVPEGLSLFNNPFRIKGDKTIYFEVEPEQNEKYLEKPVSVRFLRMNKNLNVDKIAFYYDGKIIPAQIETLE